MKETPEKIKVSVILPSLNVVAYIKECMESVMWQTLDEIEIISIDAGSTDGTWEVLCEYANHTDHKERIRLIQTEVRSYGYQVNLGIREARGEYIAILETDDWVEPDMYRVLYDIAQKHSLDMIKADYEDFFITPNGKKLIRQNRMWEKFPERYQKVYQPKEIQEIWWLDRNVWKGIYKKSFLINNEIYFNESQGAAYQDIGFMQMVLAHAQRVMYIDQSFYRYRVGREGASVNSLKGLQYAYQEMNRLINNEHFYGIKDNKKGFFTFMALSFLGEYTKLIAKLDYDQNSYCIREYYPWFQNMLQEAISKEWIQWDYLEETIKKNISLLLEDEDAYVANLREMDMPRRSFYEKIEDKRVYVFGAGRVGKRISEWMLRRGVEVIDICDNDENKWNTKVTIFEVHSPSDSISRFHNDTGNKVFVIANRCHENEIIQQLMRARIPIEQIERSF